MDLGSISLLIPKSKEGDPLAREQLLEEMQGFLEIVASQNLGADLKQKVGASDIVQLSFLRVVENFEKFKGNSSGEFRAWLKTIVVNEINKTHRAFHTKKRERARERSIDAAETILPNSSPADRHMTPSSEAVSAERIQLFHEILEQLTPDHAEIIRLRNLEQLGFKEIGEKMDRSEDAASKLWYRAMLVFEEKLKGNGNFESM